MKPRQLLKQFKEVPWLSQQQLDDVAEECLADGVDAGTVGRLLSMLLDKKLAGDNWKERMRLGLFQRIAQRVRDPALCLPYVRALSHAPTGLRQFLLSLIPQVEHANAHAELCELLRSPDKNMRMAILEMLPHMQRGSVVQQLHKLMKRPDFAGAQEVLELLMHLDYANAMQALEHTIKKGDPSAQEKALQYLAKRGRSRSDVALRLIRPAMQSQVERVRVAAIEAFSAVCSEEAYFDQIAPLVENSKVSVGRAAIRGAKNFRSKRILRMLERAFSRGPEGISLTVLQVLEAIGNDAILPLLVKALAHPQLMIRSQAGDILANLGREGKVELARAVIWLLRSRDENVRRMAAELSSSVTDPDDQFWPKLMTFLLDEDWWVRERVMDTLMETASEMLARYIVQYLSAPSSVVRLFAVEILGRLKKPEALGILVRTAMHDEDWWVREKAIEAIGEMGDKRGIAYLIDIMNREESLQWSCVQSLDRLGAVEAAPHVAALLRSHSSDIRLVALRCLESFRAVEFASAVEPLQQDPDPEVRKRANLLFEQWKIRAEYGQQYQHVEPLDQLLIHAHQMNGDDLLLAPGRCAFVKRMGQVVPLSDYRFTDEQLRNIILPHLTPHQLKSLNDMDEVDFSHEIRDKRLRFRAHVFQQHDGLAGVFRLLRSNWLRLSELGLPPIVKSFGEWKDGLVLIGGPTGSGKTMTISALVDEINQGSSRHIISLEDPIEVVHRPAGCLINQREIGTHTRSFAQALRATLRQDPDVILVGELRDFATISFAMTAADTGHLVLGTVHTVSADSTIDRILNVYPSNQQEQARSMLAQNLRAVVCQNLLKGKGGAERHLAAEIMLNTEAVANMIRKGKTHQLPATIASNREVGMQSMDQEILRLYQSDLVSPEEAYMKARNKKEFEWMVGGDEAIEALHNASMRAPSRSQASMAAAEYKASQDGILAARPSDPQEGRARPGSMAHMVAHAEKSKSTGERSSIHGGQGFPGAGRDDQAIVGQAIVGQAVTQGASQGAPQGAGGRIAASLRGENAGTAGRGQPQGSSPPHQPHGGSSRGYQSGMGTPSARGTGPAVTGQHGVVGREQRASGPAVTGQRTPGGHSSARPAIRSTQGQQRGAPAGRDAQGTGQRAQTGGATQPGQRVREILTGGAPDRAPTDSSGRPVATGQRPQRERPGTSEIRPSAGLRTPSRPRPALRRGDDPPKRS